MNRSFKTLVRPLAGVAQRGRKLTFKLLTSDRSLKWRAAYARWRSRAAFIAITGSSGKSTTTALISHILSGVAPVRMQMLRSLISAHIRALLREPLSERFYVGEIGATGPGSLQPVIGLLKPSIGVVTLVALEHKSAFRTIEAVAEEKGKLVEALPAHGLAVLNYDDPRVLAMAGRIKARAVTFGQTGGDYVVGNVKCREPEGLGLTVRHRGQIFEVASRLTGLHQSSVVAAAFACTHQLGVPPATIVERIANFEPLFGRCSVHRIDNGPVFIVDTAKAPYHSLDLSLDMLAGFDAPRKRIVIGQISDTTGGSSDNVYRRVYKAARAVADQVIFVGDHAHRSNATAADIAAWRFVEKRSIHEAAQFVKETAMPGELIVLKGGQRWHLERIMLNFAAEVRCWKDVCGRGHPCLRFGNEGCGRYEVPFEQQKPNRHRKALQAK